MSNILKFPNNPKKQADPEQTYELVKEHCHVLLECLYRLQHHVSAIEQAAVLTRSKMATKNTPKLE